MRQSCRTADYTLPQGHEHQRGSSSIPSIRSTCCSYKLRECSGCNMSGATLRKKWEATLRSWPGQPIADCQLQVEKLRRRLKLRGSLGTSVPPVSRAQQSRDLRMMAMFCERSYSQAKNQTQLTEENKAEVLSKISKPVSKMQRVILNTPPGKWKTQLLPPRLEHKCVMVAGLQSIEQVEELQGFNSTVSKKSLIEHSGRKLKSESKISTGTCSCHRNSSSRCAKSPTHSKSSR